MKYYVLVAVLFALTLLGLTLARLTPLMAEVDTPLVR